MHPKRAETNDQNFANTIFQNIYEHMHNRKGQFYPFFGRSKLKQKLDNYDFCLILPSLL